LEPTVSLETEVRRIEEFAAVEFFVNIPLDLKENDEHALDFALYLSRFFRSW
jgi:hypothetical protein